MKESSSPEDGTATPDDQLSTDTVGVTDDGDTVSGGPAERAQRSSREGPAGPRQSPADAAGQQAQPLWALRGAVAFLTRVPMRGRPRADWDAFRQSPWTYPVVGALTGGLGGAMFLLPPFWPTAVTAYVAVTYALTRGLFAEGLAEFGSHGLDHTKVRRGAARADGITPTGGLLLGLSLIGMTLGAIGLATSAAGLGVAFRVVLASEIGTKLGMGLLVCLSTHDHSDMDDQLTAAVAPISALPALLVAGAALVAAPAGSLPALVGSLLAGPALAVGLVWRTPAAAAVTQQMAAVGELGRVLALHIAVVLMTVS